MCIFFFFLLESQLLDIRDATTHSIKTIMSEQSENSNEIEKNRTEITVDLVDEKDIPEVQELLKEFFIGVSRIRFRFCVKCIASFL